ncbi:CGNR zinc finger domain-containing protein [Ornithinimicrobium sp. F0845]|uniref:CGNR zinc finger domain-containing protein n=1 Tax=Ornithinimicrobium sp. F0845 TaxID=2926412 RepID=UPI001FF134D1|nr:CGNR zinc finger domain-containing protein [Ornithinimicrobium sp. F0845]MCK0112885.1 CGNR zinc finger domain-containing protein [Ornithinimicrobium sp. F0845]
MIFAHDTEVSLASTVALINTAHEPVGLTSTEELDAFVTEWRWTGSRTHDEAELKQVLRLRRRLQAMWLAPEETLVAEVNRLLQDCRALPQLVRHDEWDWHLHATRDDQPLGERMAVEAAMALVDVIRSGELERLAVCAADDCDNVLIDLSRNRSRRYCDAGCTNRMAAQAYRARRSKV